MDNWVMVLGSLDSWGDMVPGGVNSWVMVLGGLNRWVMVPGIVDSRDMVPGCCE